MTLTHHKPECMDISLSKMLIISTDQAKAIAHWKYFGSGGSALRKKVFEKYRQRVKLRWRGY